MWIITTVRAMDHVRVFDYNSRYRKYECMHLRQLLALNFNGDVWLLTYNLDMKLHLYIEEKDN